VARTNSINHLNARAIFLKRFILFRRALEGELKDVRREGLHLKIKRDEKEDGLDGM